MSNFIVQTYIGNCISNTNNNNKFQMDTVKETMSRLKLIGSLKKGERLNTKKICIQPDSFITSLSRTFLFQDNRQNTLSFIESTIRTGLELLKLYSNNKKDDDSIKLLCLNLFEDILNSKIGLLCLKDTYSTDIKFCCDVTTIIQCMDAELTKYNYDLENNLSNTNLD